MKTLEELKMNHTVLLAEGLALGNAHGDARQNARLRKKICKTVVRVEQAIRLTEQGTTAEVLRSQMRKLSERRVILDSRLVIPDEADAGVTKTLRRAYERAYGYPDMRRQMAFMRWMLYY